MKDCIYLIYDFETLEVWDFFETKKACLSVYQSMYDGYFNIKWVGISKDFVNEVFKSHFLGTEFLFDNTFSRRLLELSLSLYQYEVKGVCSNG